MAPDNSGVRTTALVILAVVAGAVALFLGREFFQPIAIAVLLAIVCRPLVRGMERARVPTALGALIVVLGFIALLFLLGLSLARPVQQWFHTAPQTFEAARDKLARIRRPVEQVNQAINTVTQAASSQPTTQASVQPSPVAPQGSGALDKFFGTTTAVVGGGVEVIVLLLLLLAAGDSFSKKLGRSVDDQRNARRIVDEVESVVLRYMVATALINIGQAAVVMAVLKWLGMPHVLLWGLFTFVLEFIPYLGAAIMIALLAITALTTFDSIGHILAVPGSYLIITNLQNNLVSPVAYGNHLRLNPVAVLIGVLLWWFLWGIPGAFVAVPILAATKIIADRSERARPLGEFLGE